jgi:dipeptidyl-peptidase 4
MKYAGFLLMLLTQISFAQTAKKQITLEDIWKNNTFKIKSVAGFNGMKDGERYTQIDKEGDKQVINIYDLGRGKKEGIAYPGTLVNGQKLEIDAYTFSPDEQKILIKTASQNIYRRSVLYYVFVYDIKTGRIDSLSDAKVLHATFSPDGNKVAFVKNNNLFYKDLITGETIFVTNDGEWNKIINGNCDWVYEEEFEFTRAFEWSTDGRYIAYYRFDETNVPEYTLPMYNGLYPDNYEYKYPKAGEPNSIVEIKIFDTKKGVTRNANIGTETDQYIPRIKWTKDPLLFCVYRMNRLQNKLELLLVNADNGQSSLIYTEENKYYVEVNDNLEFLPDRRSFIFNSERDGYNHLYNYDWQSQKLTDLTKGNFDIDQIIGIDEKRKLVYYTAAETTPVERKLYSVSWNGKTKKILTPERGVHSITKVEGYNYFLDKYSILNVPPVYSLRDANGKIVRTLEDNIELKAKMMQYDLGEITLQKLEVADDKVLNAWMITPPNFDANKKYPVLLYQYSGPGSQEVADRFPIRDFFWHQMLAQKGYIIVCADGTGTGYRGEEFKKKTYLQLGKYESDDQILVAKYMARQKYVDKNRIGIWGWSYGGFMSSTCIFKGNDVFKMGIAVAPVTNWRYYDNIYTERYMRTPAENQSGYDDNAPEKMADSLKGKFLLVHGTADDNVHFQNAVMLTDALIKADKEFDNAYYPNKHHGISGGNTRLHLYNKMTNFILQNL